ncbi:MAG TPA: hypothetical protein VK790_09670 [Solirubrobacteraceae bacterium]|nr:hypothetical protein [Solirubrobacteraceae bacterium]
MVDRALRSIGVAAALTAALLAASPAYAEETVRITEAGFSPDVLGAPTNAFGSVTIASSTPVPSPIIHVDVFGPAGLTLNLAGSGTCVKERLEQIGPKGCPANSKAGVGGGEGAYELAHEVIREAYTLELFLADNRPGHVALLAFLKGSTPVSIEIIFGGTVITGPPPYGLGFSLEVPLIKVLPEASDASATSAFLKLGANGLTYEKTVHGRRTRLPIKGIVLPKHCPRGGWPVASQFSFQDGATVMAKRTIRCP